MRNIEYEKGSLNEWSQLVINDKRRECPYSYATPSMARHCSAHCIFFTYYPASETSPVKIGICNDYTFRFLEFKDNREKKDV